MNVIVVDVFGPGGPIGRFGFFSVPRVGEEVRLPDAAGGRRTVTKVLHFADPNNDGKLAPPTQIYVA